MNFKNENRNIVLFYILTVAVNCWFIASNWIYFWTKYMTYGELGWIEGIAFGFAILLEIPSGAVADLLGKKRTIQIAMMTGFLGTLIIATATSMPIIFTGWMIAQIGYAFWSGAGEALAYDSLVSAKKEGEYDKVISKNHSIELYTTAATIFIGGFVYAFNFRLPQFLWAGGFLIGVIASWLIIEPKVDSIKFSLKNYFKQLGMGVKEIIQPKLRGYIIFALILTGIYYMYSWGFIQPTIATSFGFYAQEQSVIFAVLTLFTAFIIGVVPYLRKRFSDILGLMILSVLLASGFLLAYFPIGYWGIIPLIIIAVAGKLAAPWISIIVNKEIPSKYRATTLSTVALISRVPYVIVAVVAGDAIQNNQLNLFNARVGTFIVIGIILGILLHLLTKPFRKNEVQVQEQV